MVREFGLEHVQETSRNVSAIVFVVDWWLSSDESYTSGLGPRC